MPKEEATKKSLEQVTNDLKAELLTNARDLLKKDYKEVVTNDVELHIILKKIAMGRFKAVYGYDFNELASVVKPTKSLGTNQPANNLCSIVPPLGTQIQDYLKKGVFDMVQLPTWMAEVAKSDLTNIAKNFVEKDTAKKWIAKEYTRSYDAQLEDKESYQCDSVLVYCNGSLLEDGSTANLCVIYFVGVYYTVKTESKKTRDEIQTSAYTSAAALAGVSAIPTVQDMLKETLDLHAKKKFETEFKYKYDTNPPTSLQALSVTGSMIGRNSNLCYIPDFKVEDLKNYIEMQVFKGIGLNLPTIRTTAIDNIVGVYNSILKNAGTNSWNMNRIDQTYTHADPTLNPIRQTGIIMSWYGHKTTQQNVTISVTYIYFMTIVYEEQNAKHELSRELFKQLCNNLRVHLKAPDAGTTLDALAMKNYMFSYAKEKWNQIFEFEYKGLKTEPLDKKVGKAVQSFEKLFFLEDYPAPTAAVEKWMDVELFKRTDTRFPAFMRSDMYDDLRDRILHYASKETPKDANFWYEGEFNREFIDPGTEKRDLKHYGLFVYALGDMALDKMDGTKEGVHIQRLFIYYLGVASSFVPAEW